MANAFLQGTAETVSTDEMSATQHGFMRVAVSCAAAALLAIALYIPIAILVAPLISRADSDLVPQILARPELLNPEPVESSLFQIALLWFPVCFAIFSRFDLMRDVAGITSGRLKIFCVVFTFLFVALCVWASGGENYFYMSQNALVRIPRAAIPSCAILAIISWIQYSRDTGTGFKVLVFVAVAGHCLLVVLPGVFTISDPYIYYGDGHFESVFFSVLGAVTGRPPLMDAGTQYGLFGVFLAPIFKVVGLTVGGYSIVMSLLATISLVLLWDFLRRGTGHIWLSTLGWSASVSISFMLLRGFIVQFMTERLGTFWLDPYHQFLPIRLLFPSLALALAALAVSRPRSFAYKAVATCVLAVGVLWNFDTGVIAFVAWLAFLGYLELIGRARRLSGWRGVAVWIGVGAASIALTTLLFSTTFRLVYGQFPDWSLFTVYQEAFYGTGFFMLPMPLRGSWLIAGVVYILGLAWSLSPAFRRDGEGTPHHALVLMLSVIGCGFFAYYQGRSHPWVLPGVVFPAVMLVTFFLARLLNVYRSRALAAAIAAGLASWVAGGVYSDYEVRRVILRRLQVSLKEASGEMPAPPDLSFLQDLGSRAKPLFLSNAASVLYLMAGTPPEFSPSLTELIRTRDLERLVEALAARRGEQVVVADQNCLERIRNDPLWQPIWRVLSASYSEQGSSPSGDLVVFSPRQH